MSDIHDRLLRLAQQLEDQHAPQHMTILMREAANRLSNHRKETLDHLGQVEQLSEELERVKREAERAQDAYGVRFLNYLEETARLSDEITRLRAELEQCQNTLYRQIGLTIQASEDATKASAAEIERLRAALRDDPTPEQVADACLSFRHDYGLMPKVDRARLAWEATEWLRAWQKTFACTALGEKP